MPYQWTDSNLSYGSFREEVAFMQALGFVLVGEDEEIPTFRWNEEDLRYIVREGSWDFLNCHGRKGGEYAYPVFRDGKNRRETDGGRG